MAQITWLQMALCLIGVGMQLAALHFARRRSRSIGALMPAKVVAFHETREAHVRTASPPMAKTELPAVDPIFSPPCPEPFFQPAKTAAPQVRPGLLVKTEKVFFVR